MSDKRFTLLIVEDEFLITFNQELARKSCATDFGTDAKFCEKMKPGALLAEGEYKLLDAFCAVSLQEAFDILDDPSIIQQIDLAILDCRLFLGDRSDRRIEWVLKQEGEKQEDTRNIDNIEGDYLISGAFWIARRLVNEFDIP